jgi:hypothetical protein
MPGCTGPPKPSCSVQTNLAQVRILTSHNPFGILLLCSKTESRGNDFDRSFRGEKRIEYRRQLGVKFFQASCNTTRQVLDGPTSILIVFVAAAMQSLSGEVDAIHDALTSFQDAFSGPSAAQLMLAEEAKILRSLQAKKALRGQRNPVRNQTFKCTVVAGHHLLFKRTSFAVLQLEHMENSWMITAHGEFRVSQAMFA